MNEMYFVPFEEAESEFTEKRSRFIGHVFRVESEEEARARIEQVKKRRYDARHNCWCFSLHERALMRYGDDGEPQGTAGQPMLNVFARGNVENVVCVVTRYFGGVLLGAGGLARAYGRAAKEALDAAGKARMTLWTRLRLRVPYPLLERVERLSSVGVIEERDSGEDVALVLRLPAEHETSFAAALTELSNGTLAPEPLGELFLPGARE